VSRSVLNFGSIDQKLLILGQIYWRHENNNENESLTGIFF